MHKLMPKSSEIEGLADRLRSFAEHDVMETARDGTFEYRDGEVWAGMMVEAASAISRLSTEVQELRAALPSAETLAMIEQMVAGTAPLSKWMASIDYWTLDGFEEYLEAQLRDKLTLKVNLDKKRADDPESESLATFVDGGTAAIEGALATYRVVRARAALKPETGK